MHTRILWPALLLVAAAACSSDGVGPVDMPWERAFDMPLPRFRQLSLTPTDEARPAADTLAAAASYSIDDLPSDYAELLSRGTLIAEGSSADAGFHTDHKVAFGQALGTSRGSYYRNEVKLRLRYAGQQIAEDVGFATDHCNCLHLRNPWGEIANVTLSFVGECGHGVDASARHDARLEFTYPGKAPWTLLAQSESSTAHASQPPCAVGSSGGGSGTDGEWYLCYWEDYYDHNGDFVRRVDLGCMPINME